MKHHVVIGRVKTDTISDDQKVESVDGENDLRLKVYRNVSNNTCMRFYKPNFYN